MAPKANTFVIQAVELVRCAARISRSHRSKCLTLPFSRSQVVMLLADGDRIKANGDPISDGIHDSDDIHGDRPTGTEVM